MSVIFWETFWSLRHFGHFSRTVLLKSAVTVHFNLYFQTLWPKWLNFFWSLQKHFGLWPKKNSFQKKYTTILTGEV